MEMIKTKNTLKNKISNPYVIAFYVLFFAVFTVIMALCPYSADDAYYRYLDFDNWYKILHFCAGYGNGRVLGNLLGYTLSNVPFLACTVRGLSVTLLVYFMAKLVCEKKDNFFAMSLLSGVFTLLLAPLMFGEVFSWISGFSNYVPAILFALICVYCIKIYDIYDNSLKRAFLVLMVILLGSAAQLFTENATLNNAILSCIIFLVCIIKKNSKRLIAASYVLSSALGAIVMVYARLFIIDKDGIYDTVDYSAKIQSMEQFLDNVLFNLKKLGAYIPKCWVLIVILSVLSVIVLVKSNPENVLLKKLKGAIIFILSIFPVYCFLASYCFISLNSFNYKFQLFSLFLSLGMFVIYIICVILSVCGLEDNRRGVFCFLIVFASFAASYMLLLNPINSRAFYYSYVLLSLAGLILFDKVLQITQINRAFFERGLTLIILGAVILMIPVHISIYQTDKIVNEYIEYQIEQGETNVKICNLTDSEYFHHSYNSARLGYTYYKDKPQDVKFETIEITQWMKDCYQNGEYKEQK